MFKLNSCGKTCDSRMKMGYLKLYCKNLLNFFFCGVKKGFFHGYNKRICFAPDHSLVIKDHTHCSLFTRITITATMQYNDINFFVVKVLWQPHQRNSEKPHHLTRKNELMHTCIYNSD